MKLFEINNKVFLEIFGLKILFPIFYVKSNIEDKKDENNQDNKEAPEGSTNNP